MQPWKSERTKDGVVFYHKPTGAVVELYGSSNGWFRFRSGANQPECVCYSHGDISGQDMQGRDALEILEGGGGSALHSGLKSGNWSCTSATDKCFSLTNCQDRENTLALTDFGFVFVGETSVVVRDGKSTKCKLEEGRTLAGLLVAERPELSSTASKVLPDASETLSKEAYTPVDLADAVERGYSVSACDGGREFASPMGPVLLISTSPKSNEILTWRFRVEGNSSWSVGLISESDKDDNESLFQRGKTGLDSNGLSGGHMKRHKIHERWILCTYDPSTKTATFVIDDDERIEQKCSIDGSVRLALSTFNGTVVKMMGSSSSASKGSDSAPLKVGDKVKLSMSYKEHDDASGGPLSPGDVGTLIEDDGSSKPYLVKGLNGQKWWYKKKALVRATSEDQESEAQIQRDGSHDHYKDKCRICTKCGFCTGYGRNCVNCRGKDRSKEAGGLCGCGHGASGCKKCGQCKQCCASSEVCSAPVTAQQMDFQVGDKVQLSASYEDHADAKQGPLQPGDMGTIFEKDESNLPYHVKTQEDETWWYMKEALEPFQVKASTVGGCKVDRHTAKIGIKVARGPDWKWSDQDGGSGTVGVLSSGLDEDDWVEVKWPSGTTNKYRAGANGSYDLVVVADSESPAAESKGGHSETLRDYSDIVDGKFHPGRRIREGACDPSCCECLKPCAGGSDCSSPGDRTCHGSCKWTCCGKTGRNSSWPGCTSVPLCPAGHQLEKHDTGSSYTCDVCGTGCSKGVRLACKREDCDYDICSSCVVAKASAKSPEVVQRLEHELREVLMTLNLGELKWYEGGGSVNYCSAEGSVFWWNNSAQAWKPQHRSKDWFDDLPHASIEHLKSRTGTPGILVTLGGKSTSSKGPQKVQPVFLEEDIAKAMQFAIQQGGRPLNMSRINLVGQGRAGKTAFANALAGKPFKDTDSTVGVAQNMMEVSKADLISGDKTSWKTISGQKNSMSSEQAKARLAAQILAKKTEKAEQVLDSSSSNSGGSKTIVDLLHRVSQQSTYFESPSVRKLSDLDGISVIDRESERIIPEPAGDASSIKRFKTSASITDMPSVEKIEQSTRAAASMNAPSCQIPTPTMNSTHTQADTTQNVGSQIDHSAATSQNLTPTDQTQSSSVMLNLIKPPLYLEPTPTKAEPPSTKNTCDEKSDVEPTSTEAEPLSVKDTCHTKQSDNDERDNAVSKINRDLVLELAQEETGQELRLSLWDFGGQDVFYALHHLYLTRFGVYVVMFNMEWLQSQASVEVKQECLAFLRFWFNSISVHAVDVGNGSIAPIIIVGTHKDKVPHPSDHRLISDLIWEAFSSNPAWQQVVFDKHGTSEAGRSNLCFFPVNNKDSSDPVIARVRMNVQERVQKEEYTQKKVPFEWMDVVDKLQGSANMCVSLNQAILTAQECGLPTTDLPLEHETLLLLKFYHEMGMLLHHPDPSLRDLVVLDPASFLISPASKIVCQHIGGFHEQAEHGQARGMMHKLYDNLCRHAILDRRLLSILWRGHQEFQQELEILMVKYGLMVPLLDRTMEMGPSDGVAAEKFFVPSVLPKQGFMAFQGKHRPKLHGHLIFARSEEMMEWRDQGFLSSRDLEKDGFLPNGLFGQVMGKVVHECLSIHNMKMKELVLSATEISARFGRHTFVLRERRERNAVELLILVDSALLVTRRLLELVGDAVASTIPALKFALAVRSDGGQWREVDDWDRPQGIDLVVLEGQGGISEQVQSNGAKDIIVGRGSSLSIPEVYREFAAWLPPKGQRCWYDVFISYRWGPFDSELTSVMYTHLSHAIVSRRSIHTFLDTQRLEAGKNFSSDFAKALVSSKVAVPIVSWNALQRMLILGPNSAVDNVLLEWTIMVELLLAGRLNFCLPILLGPVGSIAEGEGESPENCHGFIASLFDSGILDRLPDFVCTSTAERADELLKLCGCEVSGALASRTIRATVMYITGCLGVQGWALPSNSVVQRTQAARQGNDAAATRAASSGDNNAGSSSRSTHNLAMLKQMLFKACADRVLECVERAASSESVPATVEPQQHDQPTESIAALQGSSGEIGPDSAQARSLGSDAAESNDRDGRRDSVTPSKEADPPVALRFEAEANALREERELLLLARAEADKARLEAEKARAEAEAELARARLAEERRRAELEAEDKVRLQEEIRRLKADQANLDARGSAPLSHSQASSCCVLS